MARSGSIDVIMIAPSTHGTNRSAGGKACWTPPRVHYMYANRPEAPVYVTVLDFQIPCILLEPNPA